jgi:hypothetical protein
VPEQLAYAANDAAVLLALLDALLVAARPALPAAPSPPRQPSNGGAEPPSAALALARSAVSAAADIMASRGGALPTGSSSNVEMHRTHPCSEHGPPASDVVLSDLVDGDETSASRSPNGTAAGSMQVPPSIPLEQRAAHGVTGARTPYANRATSRRRGRIARRVAAAATTSAAPSVQQDDDRFATSTDATGAPAGEDTDTSAPASGTPSGASSTAHSSSSAPVDVAAAGQEHLQQMFGSFQVTSFPIYNLSNLSQEIFSESGSDSDSEHTSAAVGSTPGAQLSSAAAHDQPRELGTSSAEADHSIDRKLKSWACDIVYQGGRFRRHGSSLIRPKQAVRRPQLACAYHEPARAQHKYMPHVSGATHVSLVPMLRWTRAPCHTE